MGTTVIHSIKTRKAMVDYLKNDYFGRSDGYELLIASQRGNTLYCLVRAPDQHRFILVFLLSGPTRGAAGDGWGYKSLDESMVPTVCDCPEKILAGSDKQSPNAVEWREKCRRQREIKALRKQWANGLTSGDRVDLIRGYDANGPECETVIFLRKHSATYFVGRFENDSTLYRMRWDDIRLPDSLSAA